MPVSLGVQGCPLGTRLEDSMSDNEFGSDNELGSITEDTVVMQQKKLVSDRSERSYFP